MAKAFQHGTVGEAVFHMAVEYLSPSPNNPRRAYDENSIAKLAENIAPWALCSRLWRVRRPVAMMPWAPMDGDLVPDAGPCSTCPKNTAMMKSLFGDDAEMKGCCTDRVCYERKWDARFAQLVEPEVAKGLVVHKLDGTYSGRMPEVLPPNKWTEVDPRLVTNAKRGIIVRTWEPAKLLALVWWADPKTIHDPRNADYAAKVKGAKLASAVETSARLLAVGMVTEYVRSAADDGEWRRVALCLAITEKMMGVTVDDLRGNLIEQLGIAERPTERYACYKVPQKETYEKLLAGEMSTKELLRVYLTLFGLGGAKVQLQAYDTRPVDEIWTPTMLLVDAGQVDLATLRTQVEADLLDKCRKPKANSHNDPATKKARKTKGASADGK